MYYLKQFIIAHSCHDNFLTTGSMTLSTIMNFFTGAEEIPPSGFSTEPTLYFNTDLYPTASTCGVELTLPSIYSRYEDFKRNMDIALQSHGGFGKW